MSDETDIRTCQCKKCVEACRVRPGWMTPEEAAKAIEAGMGSRLMRDWLEPCDEHGNSERIYCLSPAAVGHEGRDAPELDLIPALTGVFRVGQCTFLDEGSCAIHESGFKPKQCRDALACKGEYTDNYQMAILWDTDEGRRVEALWRSQA